ncbi:MAG: hypothetical protein K2N27_01665 [Ruminococcus sp.]|nr:hypothetical protein [Ruminococcus sp.]
MKNQILKTFNTTKLVEYVTDSGIRIKITYPENVPEAIQQGKINRIYNILTKHSAE